MLKNTNCNLGENCRFNSCKNERGKCITNSRLYDNTNSLEYCLAENNHYTELNSLCTLQISLKTKNKCPELSRLEQADLD